MGSGVCHHGFDLGFHFLVRNLDLLNPGNLFYEERSLESRERRFLGLFKKLLAALPGILHIVLHRYLVSGQRLLLIVQYMLRFVLNDQRRDLELARFQQRI